VHVHPWQRQKRQNPQAEAAGARHEAKSIALCGIEYPEPCQSEQPAEHMRTREKMDHRCRDRKQHQPYRDEKVCSSRGEQSKHPGKDRGDHGCGEPDGAVESPSRVERPNGNVIKPLPSEPRLPCHGRRERIHSGHHVVRENLLSRPNMPANASVSQEPNREWRKHQYTKDGTEEQIGDGWHRPAKPCRRWLFLEIGRRTSGTLCHRVNLIR